MKKLLLPMLAVLSMTIAYVPATSADLVPWNDHAAPFNFLFKNEIDSHQQSLLKPDGTLFGFLYIQFTGEKNRSGVPIAIHCGESTPSRECVIGWVMKGIAGNATFLYHENDHPVWLVNSRSDIPEPGAFAHFHWLREPETPDFLDEGVQYKGYFLELTAVRKFVFVHHEREILVKPGIDIATHMNIVSSFPGYAPERVPR
jgi:hypothetical protein